MSGLMSEWVETYCLANHDMPVDECSFCDYRSTLQHCAECGADLVDGQWWTANGSTALNGCDHEGVLDDWGREVVPAVLTCERVA